MVSPNGFRQDLPKDLQSSKNVRVSTGLTATEIVCLAEQAAASYLKARSIAGTGVLIKAKAFVIACGGLESTRLLMCSRGPRGGQLGAHSGHLGRWYMAHNEGVVANVRFSTDPAQTIYGYERDVDKVYIRRRFTFSREVSNSKRPSEHCRMDHKSATSRCRPSKRSAVARLPGLIFPSRPDVSARSHSSFTYWH